MLLMVRPPLGLTGLAVVIVGMLAVGLLAKQRQVDRLERSRASQQWDLARLEHQKRVLGQLKKERSHLRSQLETFEKLREKGPAWSLMLREIVNILGPKGPTVDWEDLKGRICLGRGPKGPRWDPRRASLTRIATKGTTIDIHGIAADYDDVAEMLKRLYLSRYFSSVQLLRNDLTPIRNGRRSAMPVSFAITAKWKGLPSSARRDKWPSSAPSN